MKLFSKPHRPHFLEDVSLIFGHRVRKYGRTPAGVLWKNSEGQQLRFELLAGILDGLPVSATISVNDFGCGYGALYEFLGNLPSLADLSYTGIDISGDMINAAKKQIKSKNAIFKEAIQFDSPADFTFVSGTFNLKIDAADGLWNDYVKSTLRDLWLKTNKGLAFNMLDKNHHDRGDGLYYADATEFLDFCSEFSNDVTLINDYPLDEWTIFIRR